MTRYDTQIGQRLLVDNALDTDDELELIVLDLRDGNDDVSVWLSKDEIIKLRDHLNKVLENEANAVNN